LGQKVQDLIDSSTANRYSCGINVQVQGLNLGAISEVPKIDPGIQVVILHVGVCEAERRQQLQVAQLAEFSKVADRQTPQIEPWPTGKLPHHVTATLVVIVQEQFVDRQVAEVGQLEQAGEGSVVQLQTRKME